MVLNPSVRKNALSGLAEVCRDLWRAECVTKGACSVRGGATGDRWLRDRTAPVVYSTVIIAFESIYAFFADTTIRR